MKLLKRMIIQNGNGELRVYELLRSSLGKYIITYQGIDMVLALNDVSAAYQWQKYTGRKLEV
jgi:hypothetical protein